MRAPVTGMPERTVRDRIRAHRLFLSALGVATLLRIIAMVGYGPSMWFSDSFTYVHVALHPGPDPIRPSGYGLLLLLLRPFHSFALVTGVQHLMGLGTAVMIYLLLRRRFGLPGWGATLAAVPIMFDSYQIQLEQLILSDAPFIFLIVAAITVLLWRDRPSWRAGAAAGGLLSLAALTRSLGLAVIVAAVGYLLVRRVRLRTIGAVLAAAALPLSMYAGWFYAEHGKVALTRSDGVFLYVRVMAFADCNKIDPPVQELPLCTTTPPDKRPPSQNYLWARDAPLHRLPDLTFSAGQNTLAGDFAERAILAQPGDYLRVVAKDFFRVFQWNRTVYPDYATFNRYRFGTRPDDLGQWSVTPNTTAAQEAAAYERGPAHTKIVEPFAAVMRGYQAVFRLPGTLLGVILLIGLFPVRRRTGRRARFWQSVTGAALLPWITSVGLLLAPAATAEFDYRYILPAVPLACIAAALTFARPSADPVIGEERAASTAS
jgi:hypothetical protein